MLPKFSLSGHKLHSALASFFLHMQHCTINNTMPWGCSRLLLQTQHLDFPACYLGKQTNDCKGTETKFIEIHVHPTNSSWDALHLSISTSFFFKVLRSWLVKTSASGDREMEGANSKIIWNVKPPPIVWTLELHNPFRNISVEIVKKNCCTMAQCCTKVMEIMW